MPVNEIQPEGLVAGAFLIFCGTGIALRRSQFASILYRYYNSIPDPKWRPRWLPWQFRPTRRQMAMLSWLAIMVSYGLGLAAILEAFL